MTRKPGNVVDEAFENCRKGLNNAVWVGEIREERDELVYGMMYLKHMVEVLMDQCGVLMASYSDKAERVDGNLNKMHRYLESVEDYYVDCD